MRILREGYFRPIAGEIIKAIFKIYLFAYISSIFANIL